MPASVAGICKIFNLIFLVCFPICHVQSAKRQGSGAHERVTRENQGSLVQLTPTMSVSLLRPSFSNRVTRLRAFARRACGSPSMRGSIIVVCGPSTRFMSASPSSTNLPRREIATANPRDQGESAVTLLSYRRGTPLQSTESSLIALAQHREVRPRIGPSDLHRHVRHGTFLRRHVSSSALSLTSTGTRTCT